MERAPGFRLSAERSWLRHDAWGDLGRDTGLFMLPSALHFLFTEDTSYAAPVRTDLLAQIATNSIANTTDDTLYQSDRWNFSTLSYNIPLQNGSYNPTLKWAEIFFDRAGNRVFDVVVEGTERISSLDM